MAGHKICTQMLVNVDHYKKAVNGEVTENGV
jgi:hypothetical protein